METNNFLITPSLLSSFQYYVNYDEERERDKYGENYQPKTNKEIRQEFLTRLSREKTPSTPKQQEGLDFEAMIEGHLPILADWESGIEKIQKIVGGGIWQAVVKKPLIIGNIEYLLYGKCDVMKEDTIFDIKFTKSYEVGKFSNSSQHRIYLYCSGLPKFVYLASDGSGCWHEEYANHSKIEEEIKGMIAEFISYLKGDAEASKLFYERWQSAK